MAELEKNAFINDEKVYDKKIISKPVPEKIKDVDVDDVFYDDIISSYTSSQLNLGALTNLSTTAENRNQMYNMYDVMCQDGSIGAVIKTYAEDSTEMNDQGHIVWAKSDDIEVLKYIEFLLDTLNIDKYIFDWALCLCKYGDVYVRLVRESDYADALFDTRNKKVLKEDVKIKAYNKNDSYAHYMEMVSNPAEMFELTKFGKTMGYIKAPVANTIIKQENTLFNTFTYKFKKDDVTIYPATEFVHGSLQDNMNRVKESVNIFLDDNSFKNNETDYTYNVKRGESLLSNIYKIWRNLNLLEASVLLNRVTKSSIVRLINVEVGDMPKEQVNNTLIRVKQLIEQKTSLDNNNAMGEYTDPGPIVNNVYVPAHEGKGTITTSEIGGDIDVKGLADLDYYINKLYGALGVPKQYFCQTDDSTGFNGGTSLSIISSRYAKSVKRIQNTLIQMITDAINLMLLDKGLDSYINKFTIHMLTPSTQEEIDRQEGLSNKIGLISDIMNMLTDVEEPAAKLRILKSLLSNAIHDSEITDILQEQIDELEENVETESEEKEDIAETEFEEFGPSKSDNSEENNFNNFSKSETSDSESKIETNTEEESEESILPNADQLNINLFDSENEAE